MKLLPHRLCYVYSVQPATYAYIQEQQVGCLIFYHCNGLGVSRSRPGDTIAALQQHIRQCVSYDDLVLDDADFQCIHLMLSVFVTRFKILEYEREYTAAFKFILHRAAELRA